MRLKTIKSVSEIKLENIGIELEIHDKVIRAIKLWDVNGLFLRIEAGESYSRSLYVQIEEPPEKVERFQVTAQMPNSGMLLQAFFETKEEAGKRQDDLLRDGAINVKVETKEVDAPTTDVKEANEIPF